MQIQDDRKEAHSLSDFTLRKADRVLPINVKNAGTRYENAQEHVGISPEECVPIATYKAFQAVDDLPDLLYAFQIDHDLGEALREKVPEVLTDPELIVWDLIQRFKGLGYTKAEDAFMFSVVERHSGGLGDVTDAENFYLVSAKRAIRTLNEKPDRAPGVGV